MTRTKTIINVIFTLVIVGVVGMVTETIYTTRTTGVLKLTTDDTSAVLAISSTDTSAEYIGQGSANIRLRPGTYQISATDQGISLVTNITITKQQKTTKYFAVSGQIQKSQKYNKLIAQLPLLGPALTYTINYYMAYHNGRSSPVITITAPNPQGTQAAQSWLQSNGFDLSSLQIQYITQQLAPSDINEFVGSTQP